MPGGVQQWWLGQCKLGQLELQRLVEQCIPGQLESQRLVVGQLESQRLVERHRCKLGQLG